MAFRVYFYINLDYLIFFDRSISNK